MSTNENAAASESSSEALVTYIDGRELRVGRLDRPGILVRVERAHPEIEFGGEGEVPSGLRRPSVFFYMVYWALRLDHAEGDPARPGDDFDAWIDTVADVDPIANPTTEPPAEKPTGAVEKPREPMVVVAP